MAFDYTNYYELEYIQSSGTQYIDTEYYPNNNSKIEFTLNVSNSVWGWGCRNSNATELFYTASFSGDNGRVRFGYNNTNFISQINRTAMVGYDTNFVFNGNVFSATYNGNTLSNTFSSGTFTCTYSFYLFALHNYNNGAANFDNGGKLKLCKIWENNVLVRNFIPAKRKSDGTLGLYDTVTGIFFTNAGSGSFTGGKRVSQDFDYDTYYELNYLQSSGTQYIDSGFCDDNGVLYDFKVEFPSLTSNTSIVFGTTSSSYRQYLGFTTSSTILGLGTGSVSPSHSYQSNVPYVCSGSFKKGQISVVVNNESVYSATTSPSYSNSHTLYIFGTYNHNNNTVTNKSTEKLYYLNLYDTNGVLERGLIPAERKSDGVLGYFDTVYGVFYTNIGSGTFISGGRIQYVITGDVTPTGSGYVSGTGSFYKGETTTLVATANTGYAFQQWSDGVLTDTRTITVTEDATYTASFYVPISITLVYDSNYGTASYVWSGQNIILTATPNSSGQFVGWYIGSTLLSTNNPYTYTPTGDVTIECRFEEVFNVTASVNGNGSISYTRGVDKNDVTFTVIPDEHYHFVKYSVNGMDTATNPLTIHLTQATTVIAYFEEDTVHHITATTNIGYNSVFISANDVYYGTPVTLWARPYPNYNFVRWDDGSTENPRTITVTANVTMVAIFQREFDTNGIYQYRCYVKDQMDLEDPPKAFMRVDTFNIKNDLMTTANSTITVLDSFSNVNNGDVLVLYDPMGTTLYQGVIKSIEDNKIVCSQMQSFYSGTWIYNIYPSATLEEELAYLLGQYAQGKMYNSTYTDPLVAQRLGGITIDYTASTSVNLPSDLDSDGNENLTEYDMEKFIYEMYEKYGIIFDFEINFAGTNYVHIKVPTYSSMKVGNNMYAIKDMKPVTAIEETNRLIIFAQDKSYRTTYVATANSIEEEPSTTANRFDLTNTKIVYSDDAVADLIAANLPDQMYNHKLDFTLVIKNFIYQFGDFNLGGSLDIYYYDEYYNSVLSGYEISKASNQNITEVKMVCGKVRSKLTQKLTLGRLQ